jgi:rod shape determining protein RodA
MTKSKFDIWFILFWIAIVIYGVVAIYTASATKIGDVVHIQNFYLKQSIFIVLAATIVAIIYKIPYPIIDLLIIPGFIFTCLLLILVLIAPKINGSHRWLMLGGLRLQPSEFAKLATILFVSKLLAPKHLSELNIMIRTFLAFILPCMLIIIEPDLGTTIILSVAALGVMLAAGLPFYYVFLIISPVISIMFAFKWGLFLAFIFGSLIYLLKNRLSYVVVLISTLLNTFVFFLTPVLWNHLKTYQQNRILTFLDPTRDPLGAGYQVIQAKIAIGSGMFSGKGFLNGTQKNLDFLPENHTDFIFSVIGEEFGFMGSSFLILLFFLFCWRVLHNIKNLSVKEYRIASYGIIFYIVFQIFVNMGMNMGVVPTTGVPLPFISYGGSNLLVNSIAFGMILKYIKIESKMRY